MSLNKFIRITILIVSSSILGTLSLSAQNIAVKHNLLYDVALTPNLGFEGRLAPRWTAGLNVGYTPFPLDDHNEKKLRHLLVAPEARYWLCSAFAGHFLGFNAAYSHFNVSKQHFPLGLYPSLKSHRYQGDMIAGGLFYGYSWLLSTRWSIEAELGIDVGLAWFRKYDCTHCGTYYGHDNKTFAMPKAGVNIVYNIK